MRRAFAAAAATLGVVTTFALTSYTAAIAAPAGPPPTSSARSPEAPDPRPPLGGRAPNGSVAGGDALLSRGVIVPKGAPKLPGDVMAHGWVMADLGSGQILAARDPHGRYQPASILKLLTAITVLPNLPGTKVVTVSPGAAHMEGSAVGLLEGAPYTVDQLFGALLLVSGNDAATALAEANGGVAKTVADMNSEAENLGAYDTFVQTPSGLDGWQQLTSAYDMALILRAAVGDRRLVDYDRTLSVSYPEKKNGKGGVIPAFSFANQLTNFFTAIKGAQLAKSGYTDAARHTYVASARRNGRTLGVVLLRDTRWPVDTTTQADHLFAWAEKLPRGTQPVGVLAGPIDAAAPVVGRSLPAQPTAAAAPAAGQAAPLLSQAPDAANAADQGHPGAAGKAATAGFRLNAGWLLGAVGLVVATFAILRRQRHLQLRRR